MLIAGLFPRTSNRAGFAGLKIARARWAYFHDLRVSGGCATDGGDVDPARIVTRGGYALLLHCGGRRLSLPSWDVSMPDPPQGWQERECAGGEPAALEGAGFLELLHSRRRKTGG